MSPDELEIVRRAYARQMLGRSGIVDTRVERAFATVRREDFLGGGPWAILNFGGQAVTLTEDDPVLVQQDVLVALDPARGVNNGSPSLHAFLLHHLKVEPGQTVFHAGAGAGYYTAILAEMVGPAGRVIAVEHDADMAAIARRNLAPWPRVEVVVGDAAELPGGPVDRVYVNFGVCRPATPWIDRLTEGGRAIFTLGVPSTNTSSPRHQTKGAAFLVERRGDALPARRLCAAYFVFAEGALARAEDAQALSRAFDAGMVEAVRSLLWRRDADPARCWCFTADWALSYDPA